MLAGGPRQIVAGGKGRAWIAHTAAANNVYTVPYGRNSPAVLAAMFL